MNLFSFKFMTIGESAFGDNSENKKGTVSNLSLQLKIHRIAHAANTEFP